MSQRESPFQSLRIRSGAQTAVLNNLTMLYLFRINFKKLRTLGVLSRKSRTGSFTGYLKGSLEACDALGLSLWTLVATVERGQKGTWSPWALPLPAPAQHSLPASAGVPVSERLFLHAAGA